MNSPKQRKNHLKVLQRFNKRNSKILVSLFVIFGLAGLASGVEILKNNHRTDQGTFQTDSTLFGSMESPSSISLDSENPELSEKIDIIEKIEKIRDLQPLSASIPQEFFGFELILPGKHTSYQDLPVLAINITNEGLVGQTTYMFRIGNRTESTAYDNNTISDWMLFAPLESASITEINAIFSDFWGHTAEGVPIAIEFLINLETPYYEILIYKDLSPPDVLVGFDLTENNTVIPVEIGSLLFNTPPTIFFNFTDNVPNDVSLSFMVNNRIHDYSISVHDLIVNPILGGYFYNGLANISLFTEEVIWGNIIDGNVTFAYNFHDAAGNPTEWKFLSFIKDTVSPHLDSGIADRSWLMFKEFEESYSSPIVGNAIEVTGRPQIQITLYDTDVKMVGLKILNVPSISTLNTSSLFDTPTNAGSSPKSAELDEYIYISGIQNGSNWIIDIAPEIWDSLEDGLLDMQLELEDFAGNQASFSFSMVKIGNSNSNISTLYLFFGASAAIVISLIIFSAMLTVDRRQRLIQVEREKITKWDSIDPDLLDLVLEPLDHVKLARVTAHFIREGKNFDPHSITEPNLREFLNEPLQLVHLRELLLLLTRYHMNPMDQEEFVHEMFSLSPQERRGFILRYMESGKRDLPKVKSMCKKSSSEHLDSGHFASHIRLPSEIVKEVWGTSEVDIGPGDELLGEEEDPWESFESLPDQEDSLKKNEEDSK
ncbi:MAG: hypothetical protein ACTSYI_12920 [Promethearchaeota archaeon]